MRWTPFRKIMLVVSSPLIYGMVVPALMLDVSISLYQLVCFSIYGIPQVKRQEHFHYRRHQLPFLKSFEKVNCFYCSYFNGLASYLREIGGRTEQYWCPIRQALKVKDPHSRYNKFISFGDAKTYHDKFLEIRSDFRDLKPN